MDDDQNQDMSFNVKLDTKQQLAQAKLKAIEKRRAHIAARRAERGVSATPCVSPFPAPPFIKNSTSSVSNHASESRPLLRTEDERVDRENSLKVLSTKIERARQSELQELIAKMILECPGAKEIAASFFVSHDARNEDEELDDRERDCAARHEDGEEGSVNHVILTRDRATRTAAEEGRFRTDPSTNTSDLQNNGTNRRCEDSSFLHPVIRPEYSSRNHNSEAPEQPDFQQQNTHLEPIAIKNGSNSQSVINNGGISRKDNTGIGHAELETSASRSRSGEASDTSINNAPICNMSGTDISNALDTLFDNIAKSRERSTNNTSTSATPKITIPGTHENDTILEATDTPPNDMLKLASDMLAKYLALVRASNPNGFSHDQLPSIGARSPHNESAKDFSFEAFNSLFESVLKNIETMERSNSTNRIPEGMRTPMNGDDRKDSSDLGSPIPIDSNGQELSRNSVSGDNINESNRETMARAESEDDEEDEYPELVDITSRHYNCDSCRKPIVLPEGFVVSPENPIPTICLHCKTLKASRMARRRLGARAQSSISTEVSTGRTDDRSLPDQIGYDRVETSQTPNQPPTAVPDTLMPVADLPSEPTPEPVSEPVSASVPEAVGGIHASIEAKETNSNEITYESQSSGVNNVKNERRQSTIIIEIPAWSGSASPRLSASQTPVDSRSSRNPGKRKVEKIEGEALYTSPIGPKRRRGRPLKDFSAALSESSPASTHISSPILGPAKRTPSAPSSQGTPISKKRGRPLGSLNRFKPGTFELKTPIKNTDSNRPISQRQSARKARELNKNLFGEAILIEDAPFEAETLVRDPVVLRSATGSTIPDSQSTSSLGIPPTRRRINDPDPEYIPPDGSPFQSGIESQTSTMSNGDAASSFASIVPTELNAEGSSTGVTENIPSPTSRTRNPSFSVDQQLQQSMEEQEMRMADGRSASTTIVNETGAVTQHAISNRSQSHPQELMYPSRLSNIANMQPSPASHLSPVTITANPIIPNRSQSTTSPIFNPATFFTRSFDPNAPIGPPASSPPRLNHMPLLAQPSHHRTSVSDRVVPNTYVPPPPPRVRHRASPGSNTSPYSTAPLVPNMTQSNPATTTSSTSPQPPANPQTSQPLLVSATDVQNQPSPHPFRTQIGNRNLNPDPNLSALPSGLLVRESRSFEDRDMANASAVEEPVRAPGEGMSSKTKQGRALRQRFELEEARRQSEVEERRRYAEVARLRELYEAIMTRLEAERTELETRKTELEEALPGELDGDQQTIIQEKLRKIKSRIWDKIS